MFVFGLCYGYLIGLCVLQASKLYRKIVTAFRLTLVSCTVKF